MDYWQMKTDKQKMADFEIRRVTLAGLLTNIALSIVKIAAGVIGKSQAVIADGIHSLSDMATDLAILVGLKYWSEPADRKHPYGHARIETLVTVAIGVTLAFAGVGMFYFPLVTLQQRHAQPPGNIALAAAVLSLVIKEGLYRWTVTVGRRIKSQALVANAWHHRSDAFSSIPAILAVAAAIIFPDWAFLDHVGAIVVSLFILQASWRIGWPALQQLIDVGADPDDVKELTKIALKTDGVERVHALRTRHLGNGLSVDLHVLVDGNVTVRKGHDIASGVTERLIHEGPDVVDVVVHVEPVQEKRDEEQE